MFDVSALWMSVKILQIPLLHFVFRDFFQASTLNNLFTQALEKDTFCQSKISTLMSASAALGHTEGSQLLK